MWPQSWLLRLGLRQRLATPARGLSAGWACRWRRPCATAEEGDRQMAGDSWRGRETGLLAAWRVEAGGQRGGVQGKQKVGGGVADEMRREKGSVSVWRRCFSATQAKGSQGKCTTRYA